MKKTIYENKFWVGFSKFKAEESEECILSHNACAQGYYEILLNLGQPMWFWEYRVFVDGKPFFRYQAKRKLTFEVSKRFGFLKIKLIQL